MSRIGANGYVVDVRFGIGLTYDVSAMHEMRGAAWDVVAQEIGISILFNWRKHLGPSVLVLYFI